MKKIKKLVALATATVMVLSLCACSSSGTNKGEGDGNKAADVKIGFICLHDENSTYDLNFINAAKEACEKAGIEPIIKTGIPEGQECYDAAADLADAGCDIVFADSFGHEDYLIQAAKEFTDVEF